MVEVGHCKNRRKKVENRRERFVKEVERSDYNSFEICSPNSLFLQS